jgi:hypothetical protein
MSTEKTPVGLLDELSAADCWCGRSEEECADNGGCRWTRALAVVREVYRQRIRREVRAATASPLGPHSVIKVSDLDRILGGAS